MKVSKKPVVQSAASVPLCGVMECGEYNDGTGCDVGPMIGRYSDQWYGNSMWLCDDRQV